MLITWTNSLSVGITKIDEQHKILIGLINELSDAMKSGKSNHALEEILSKMFFYTEEHFKFEEMLFHQYNYPDKQIHMKEHKLFIAKTLEMKADFLNNKLAISVELLKFLKDWLEYHIKKTDKEYSGFFISNGVK
jgi:hemerythrin